jgi:hypothetical protein
MSETAIPTPQDKHSPEGVYIRHAYPGDVIELVVWRSGEEPMIRKLSDKHALDLLADLATALRSNGK